MGSTEKRLPRPRVWRWLIECTGEICIGCDVSFSGEVPPRTVKLGSEGEEPWQQGVMGGTSSLTGQRRTAQTAKILALCRFGCTCGRLGTCLQRVLRVATTRPPHKVHWLALMMYQKSAACSLARCINYKLF